MFLTLMCLLYSGGLVSAASICVYTLQPIELLKKYGTTSIVGFAMFICGILSLAMFQQVESEALWDGMTWLGLFAIIILGTVVSFNAYMEGVTLIGALQGSILSSLEPISAAIFGWVLLGESFYAGRYFWHDLHHCNRIYYRLGSTPSN